MTEKSDDTIRIATPITILAGWKEGEDLDRREPYETYVDMIEERDAEAIGPDTEVVYQEVEDAVGPHVKIHHERDLAAIPAARAARAAEEEGFDAVRLICFDEPGMEAARELCDIPVMSDPCASFHVASMLGEQFSIVTSGSGTTTTLLRNIIKKYDMESRVASIRTLDVPPTGVNPTQSSEKEIREVRETALEEAKEAIEEDGADVIIGYSGSYPYLEEHLDVPVIDPRSTNLKMAETLVSLGLSHSKTAYPEPEIPHTYYLSERPPDE